MELNEEDNVGGKKHEAVKWSRSHIDDAFAHIFNEWGAIDGSSLEQVQQDKEENNYSFAAVDEEDQGESDNEYSSSDLEAKFVEELGEVDMALQSDDDEEIRDAIKTFKRWHLRGPSRLGSKAANGKQGSGHDRSAIQEFERIAEEDVGNDSKDDNELMADSDPGSYETGSDEEGNQVHIRRKPIWPRYNENSKLCHIELGMVFKNHIQFRRAIIKYSIEKKRDFSYVRNEMTRIRAVCKTKGCKWEIYASLERSKNYFQVKVFEHEHTCYEVLNISRASSRWMTNEVRDLITWHPGIKPAYIQEEIEKKFGIEFSIHQARRTKLYVMKKYERDVGYEYSRLGDYAHALRIANPGSTVEVSVSETREGSVPVFHRMYICLAALRKGFIEGCRPYIGLDGCFLKGMVKGQLLTAVGKDANNQMYPLAWAVVEVESKDSWLWFLERLKCDIQTIDGQGWAFMSDQQKGLMLAVTHVFPKAEHRLCARHIYSNWSSKFRGEALRNGFYACAKSTNEPEFKRNLQELENLKEGASAAAVRIDPHSWCKAYFSCNSKCDSVDNNCCEAFNFVLVGARSKPIISMLEDIREYIMERQFKRRQFGSKWSGEYGKKIMLKLQKNLNEGFKWQAVWNGDHGYEVKSHLSKYSVHLDIKSCECGAWQLSGIPCVHACKAIRQKGDSLMDYVAKWFKKDMYVKAYAHSVGVMSSEEMWADSGFGVVSPPPTRSMPGRPRKNRKRSKHEPRKKKTKLSRDGRKMTCSICGQTGHNKKGCKNQGEIRASMNAASSFASTSTGQGSGLSQRGLVGIGVYTDAASGHSIVNPGLPSQYWL